MTRRQTPAALGLIALFGGLLGGCTSVKFVLKNPYTAEVWTVYEHTFGSDTIIYCPPIENATCMEATFADSAAATSSSTNNNSINDE